MTKPVEKTLLFAAAMLLAATPVQAGGVGAAVAGLGAWYAAQNIVVQAAIQIGLGLAISAASYGISYLLSGSGKRIDQSQQEQGVLVPERDGLLEVRRVYGTRAAAGGVFLAKDAP